MRVADIYTSTRPEPARRVALTEEALQVLSPSLSIGMESTAHIKSCCQTRAVYTSNLPNTASPEKHWYTSTVAPFCGKTLATSGKRRVSRDPTEMSAGPGAQHCLAAGGSATSPIKTSPMSEVPCASERLRRYTQAMTSRSPPEGSPPDFPRDQCKHVSRQRLVRLLNLHFHYSATDSAMPSPGRWSCGAASFLCDNSPADLPGMPFLSASPTCTLGALKIWDLSVLQRLLSSRLVSTRLRYRKIGNNLWHHASPGVRWEEPHSGQATPLRTVRQAHCRHQER